MTMEIPAVQSERKRRRQMRTFALIWSALTLALGLATFVAIFLAAGVLLPDTSSPVVVSAAEISEPTALPTRVVVATPIPQAQIQPSATSAAVAQAPRATETDVPEPTPEPTRAPALTSASRYRKATTSTSTG